jgi:hypothetical protein
MERIRQTILLLHGQRIILDRDLAKLYGVPTKTLKQAVKRNVGRFPEDFMFVLTPEEFTKWRSQFVTSKSDRMGLRHAMMSFTEQGIAMLSSVLNSERAIRVNIAVTWTFVQFRGLLASHEGLARKPEDLEKKHDAQFKVVFDAIRSLMAPPEKPRRSIGFKVEEARPVYRRAHSGGKAQPGEGRGVLGRR